jgi:MYXO-CTERM domain-containing protein
VPAPTAQCSADSTKSVTGTTEIDCAPYRCNESTGTCRETCTATPDCVPGFVCDPDVRTCAKAATSEAPAEDSGCGCRTAGGPDSGRYAGALLLAGMALALRRRRQRS